MKGFVMGGAFVLLFQAAVLSAVLLVPEGYSTIQGAINAASAGDLVLVAPDSVHGGPYIENLNFWGKAITVRSDVDRDPQTYDILPEGTTIDGSNPSDATNGSVVLFENGEGLDSVIDGFTLANGTGREFYEFRMGGGIFCFASSPAITNNILQGNSCDDNGGGIYCYASSPVILENTIVANTAGGDGGGIICNAGSFPAIIGNSILGNSTDGDGGGISAYSSPIVLQNVITGNSSAWGGGIECGDSCFAWIESNIIHGNSARGGGGIECWAFSTPWIESNIISGNSATEYGGGIVCDQTFGPPPLIVNNTIWGNDAAYGGGISCHESWPIITNTIVWQNSAPPGQGPGIFFTSTEGPSVSYCDVQDGWPGEGNIDLDPLFVNAPGGDFHIRLDSPCIDAGADNAPDIPDADYEGDDREVDGDLDGTLTVDIGADELLPEVACRFGTVNAASPSLADVLLMNGSAGDRKRIYAAGVVTPLTLTMVPPPAGPNPAPFALYAWLGENDATTITPHPQNIGSTCFPTPVTGGNPQPLKIWNNIGRQPILGTPNFPSQPAPWTVFVLPSGVGSPVTVTFQGFILDQGSAASKPASITNAVILRVQ